LTYYPLLRQAQQTPARLLSLPKHHLSLVTCPKKSPIMLNTPPPRDEPEPSHQHPPHWSDWQSDPGWRWRRDKWHARRRFFFLRFMGFAALAMLLILGGMAALAYLITRLAGGDGQVALLVWVGGCGLALALPMLALALGARIFRSYALPLADIMEAADGVAAGDLHVQVAERGSPDFKRLARSFNRMTAELARVDQQRRNLTADVAHELRTPLHIIQGNLEGILDGVYDATPEQIEATLQETRQLARLVDDLRTLSLAEANELPLERSAVNLAELLEDVTTSFSGQAEQAGVDLRVARDNEHEHAVALSVIGDAGRLDQVLSNLVGNALRHTPPGGSVTLAVAQQVEGVTISVADSGEGIAADDLPFVFDRFWKGDRSRTQQAGAGSGLGLSIAYQLVKAHGGQIRVTSNLGEGTTFFVDLPT
jgi:signal transduction histidine kinase